MATERTYTIPLRKEWLKAPKYRRAKKAVNAVKKFLIKHMKSEDIKLGRHLNLEIWKHGIRNPPGKIKVNVIKDDKNIVRAEIYGKKIETEEKKEEEKKGIATKMKETITGKKEEKRMPVKKKKKSEKEETTENKETAKKEEKKAEPAKEEKENTAKKAEPEKTKKEEKPAEKEAKPAEKTK